MTSECNARVGDRAVFVAANLTAASAEFPSGVKPIPGVSPLLAGSGELTANGLCRLGPYGHIVADVANTNGAVP